jgi:hypothetical protein
MIIYPVDFLDARLAEWEADGRLGVVAAVRVILAEHHPTDWTAYGDHMCFRCIFNDEEIERGEHHWLPFPCRTVRAVMSIWSGHPEYRQEWAP